MASMLARLMMLVALALMPLNMASASAEAFAPSPAGTSGHCADHQRPAEVPSSPMVDCAACTALPAIETPAAVDELRPTMKLVVKADRWIAAQEPETDTPPPKNA